MTIYGVSMDLWYLVQINYIFTEPRNDLIEKLELGEFDAVLNNECFAKELDMISAFSDLNNCWKILAEKFAESLTVEEHVQRCFLNFFIQLLFTW